MKTNQRKKKKTMRCPYCGAPVVFRSADGIYRDNSRRTMLYVCSRYPVCDAYVRAHAGSGRPMGELADRAGIMQKQDAYRWLSGIVCAPMSQAHIGCLGEYYCRKVIAESKKVLARHGRAGGAAA